MHIYGRFIKGQAPTGGLRQTTSNKSHFKVSISLWTVRYFSNVGLWASCFMQNKICLPRQGPSLLPWPVEHLGNSVTCWKWLNFIFEHLLSLSSNIFSHMWLVYMVSGLRWLIDFCCGICTWNSFTFNCFYFEAFSWVCLWMLIVQCFRYWLKSVSGCWWRDSSQT